MGFVGCRADLNYGHGYELASEAYQNQFAGCRSMRNSADTTNTYDGFNVVGASNLFTGCFGISLTADGFYHRYGSYDSKATATVAHRNRYVNCLSVLHATAEFYGVAYLGSSYHLSNLVYSEFTDDDATPSVSGGTLFKETYVNPTTVTDFDDGLPGQTIKILGTSDNFTVEHGSNIKTNIGANKTLGANKIYTFIHINGVWYVE